MRRVVEHQAVYLIAYTYSTDFTVRSVSIPTNEAIVEKVVVDTDCM